MQATVNGIRIYYRLSGNPHGPAVIMSHSLATDHRMWDAQLAVLETDFRILRYDTRGHGASDAPRGSYSLELLADDAIGLLDWLDIRQAHWVGISMGGMIGQSAALRHGERLQSLVLCDTAAVMGEDTQPVWQKRIDSAGRNGMEALVDETLQRWFTRDFLSQNPPEVQEIRRQILATPVSGFIGCSEAIRRLNYLERLHEIRTPAAVIVGEQDPGTPVSASEAIHSRLRNSRLFVIPSAAHLCNIEQPAAFNRVLLDFLYQRAEQPKT
jgi:3-oxoadipate enol-lactonase